MKKKICKHKLKHIVIKARSMDESTEQVYEWVIHECIKCHKRSDELRLE